MADDTQVLLKLHELQWDGIKQAEALRSQVANLILLIASVVYGFIGQHGLTGDMLPLTLLLIGLGIYGIVISEKLYERWWFWRRRTEILEKKIDSMHPGAEIIKLWQDVDASQAKAYPRMSRVRLHYLWIALHLGIALSGVAMTGILVFAH